MKTLLTSEITWCGRFLKHPVFHNHYSNFLVQSYNHRKTVLKMTKNLNRKYVIFLLGLKYTSNCSIIVSNFIELAVVEILNVLYTSFARSPIQHNNKLLFTLSGFSSHSVGAINKINSCFHDFQFCSKFLSRFNGFEGSNLSISIFLLTPCCVQ